jgi:hypothetical protein
MSEDSVQVVKPELGKRIGLRPFNFILPRMPQPREQELAGPDKETWIEVCVCQQMIEEMLSVVCDGLDDAKGAKKWVKCALFTITKLVYESADDASREVVCAKIFERWVDDMQRHLELATEYETRGRMQTEIARCLHANGWEKQGLEKDDEAETSGMVVEQHASHARAWQKLIEKVRAK